MELVQPIRDVKKIDKMKRILKAKSSRDYLLFVLGINSGLRISDLLKFKVEDVIDNKGKVRDWYELREQKTDKTKRFIINDNIKKAVNEYMKDYNPEAGRYLFASRKGDNKPITRQHAWQILNDAARAAGITDKVGTHTLRKTFGYHAYKAGTDIVLLQQIFNHAAPSITLRYIGTTQDDIDNVYININL
jgi:site-specific recombinase XerD